jgi:WD40 repeat protein
LASGSADGTAKLWNLNSTEEARLLKESQGRATAVAYAPNGQWLATAGRDGARLWDARTELLVRELPVKRVLRIAFSPDSRMVATGGGDSLVPATTDVDFRVQLWDAATGGKLGEFQGRSEGTSIQRTVGALAFSPDGSLLAAGFGSPSNFRPDEYDQVVKVWNLRSAQEVKTLPVRNTVPSLAFSPDGTTLAAACRDGTLRRWVVETWHELPPLTASGPVHTVAFSPDGRTLVAGAGIGPTAEVHLWDAAAGREKARLKGHSHALVALAISPDGKTLASGALDGTLRLWDVASGRELRTLRVSMVNAAFSPDGNMLATGSPSAGNKPVLLWEAASPQAVAAELAEDHALEERRAERDLLARNNFRGPVRGLLIPKE